MPALEKVLDSNGEGHIGVDQPANIRIEADIGIDALVNALVVKRVYEGQRVDVIERRVELNIFCHVEIGMDLKLVLRGAFFDVLRLIRGLEKIENIANDRMTLNAKIGIARPQPPRRINLPIERQLTPVAVRVDAVVVIDFGEILGVDRWHNQPGIDVVESGHRRRKRLGRLDLVSNLKGVGLFRVGVQGADLDIVSDGELDFLVHGWDAHGA